MKLKMLLVLLIFVSMMISVQANMNYIRLNLTEIEGELLYKDTTSEMIVKNNFTFTNQYFKIEVESFPYHTEHSVEEFYAFIYPDNSEISFYVRLKDKYHQGTKITLINGDYQTKGIFNNQELFLRLGMRMGENLFTCVAQEGNIIVTANFLRIKNN